MIKSRYTNELKIGQVFLEIDDGYYYLITNIELDAYKFSPQTSIIHFLVLSEESAGYTFKTYVGPNSIWNDTLI